MNAVHFPATFVCAVLECHLVYTEEVQQWMKAHVACAQATAAQFAAVWLWDCATWAPAGAPLEAHNLTVTQMAFSPDGAHLLTVSRDRTYALFRRRPDAELAGGLHMICLNLLGLAVHLLCAVTRACSHACIRARSWHQPSWVCRVCVRACHSSIPPCAESQWL